jgi:hypothetical protein
MLQLLKQISLRSAPESGSATLRIARSPKVQMPCPWRMNTVIAVHQSRVGIWLRAYNENIPGRNIPWVIEIAHAAKFLGRRYVLCV